MIQPPANLRTFQALRQVVSALRGPDGCPWDKEQDHRSLTPYVIEEAFELVEAIEQGGPENIVEELGDCLLQVVLHAEIAQQEGSFTLEDVLESISTKMIRRHPHVFANQHTTTTEGVLATTTEAVQKNWTAIKNQEKPPSKRSFQIPVALPALQRSQKIGRRTTDFAFDWTAPSQVLTKVDEELSELKNELNAVRINQQQLEHELGDLLFSIAQLARHLNLESEHALRQANRRFEERFFAMLDHARGQGLLGSEAGSPEEPTHFRNLTPAQKEHLWGVVKAAEALKKRK